MKTGAKDNWTQDEGTVLGEDAVNELVDGKRHLKAGSVNGNAHNNPAQWPAVFVNPNEFDFTAEGFFEFTVHTKENPEHNRFGIFWDTVIPEMGCLSDTTTILSGIGSNTRMAAEHILPSAERITERKFLCTCKGILDSG